MIDAVKDYFDSKRFGVVAYVSLIVQFNCGLILIPVFLSLRASEIGKFSCAVDAQSTVAYKSYVEKTCYSRYEQTYNSPLPLYGFVLLSFGLTVLVSLIYSLAVSSHVEKIAERISNGIEGPRNDSEETSRGFYVFRFYFFHLVARSVFGIVFTVLQYTVFYPRGFDFEFSCSLSTTDVTKTTVYNGSTRQFNVTTMCENSTAPENVFWGRVVSVLNAVFALLIFVEVIRLFQWFRSENGWSCDTEFITDYLLCKRYSPNDVELTSVFITSSPLSSSPDCNAPDNNSANSSLQDCTEFYKQQVLRESLSHDVNYSSKTSLDDMYIDVVIHTGRAQHQFLKEMGRHEIYHVYTEVPSDSVRLKEIKDLFYPNKDTKGESPRTILAVGRPGIGKTVLTEKIIRDWANGIDEFYHDKIAFFFKFRWFNFEELQDMSLRTFLRHGTGGLDEEKFKIVFEQILRQPEIAIFIFDGLDEFTGDFIKCLDESRILSNDANTPMFSMTLFIKLVSGKMLRGATILVTSRPTAEDFYLKLDFDRTVEIIGYTSDKIEDYVGKFCENNNQSNLKSEIWNHIKFSPDLLNLCYVPVNSYIVCVTLSGCLTSSGNSTGALPTTLTALYRTALNYLAKYHDRNVEDTCSKRMLKELQEKAFRGMKNGQLVFNENLFDEQIRTSGLVNSLTNPISPLETQFCFIHLTIQEFLAAKHVIETLPTDKIEQFISTHIESGKWHLVLQFIAGLLGEKIKMSGSDYQDCVLAFAKSLTLHDGLIDLDDYGHVFVMKCLREVDDEGIVKNVCEKTDLSNAQTLLSLAGDSFSSSDWAAVTFVSKHLNSLIDLLLTLPELTPEDICVREASELLQQKCFKSINLRVPGFGMERLIGAMTNLKCALNHEHANLRQLRISARLKDAEISNLCTFIKDGHASHLQVLGLRGNNITSREIFELSKVLNDELCGELTYLNVGENMIRDDGVGILCNALIQGHCKIKKLVLQKCSLTAECARWLSEVLCDEHCKLTKLSLEDNAIGNECVRRLCTDALGKEQCKLTRLILGKCILTAECVRPLAEVLCDEHCKLTDLTLDRNAIRDEGVRKLCTDALRGEQCKLTKLSLGDCRLTDKCVPLLCETLKDRNCRLVHLSIWRNKFAEQGKSMLRDVQEVEICKARGLKIYF